MVGKTTSSNPTAVYFRPNCVSRRRNLAHYIFSKLQEKFDDVVGFQVMIFPPLNASMALASSTYTVMAVLSYIYTAGDFFQRSRWPPTMYSNFLHKTRI